MELNVTVLQIMDICADLMYTTTETNIKGQILEFNLTKAIFHINVIQPKSLQLMKGYGLTEIQSSQTGFNKSESYRIQWQGQSPLRRIAL